MAESSSSSTSNGMGFFGWLTLVFIVLKFNPGSHLDSPVEDWSWWWVLSPLWISFLLVIFILGGILLGTVTMDRRDRKRRQAALARRVANRR